MFFSSIKGMNRLISKGMSNIYWKVTIKKNGLSQNSILYVKFLTQISLNFKTSCCNLKAKGVVAKGMCSISVILILKGIMTF